MNKLNPFILLVVIALGVNVGLNINKEPASETTTSETTNTEPNKTEAATVPTEVSNENGEEEATNNQISEPNYQIIYSIDKRYDGGISYYVLIDPVDLNNEAFMDNVKYIVNKLVKEYGRKISIEIFDDRNALEVQYRFYGDLSLDRPLTGSENQHNAIHYIAGYSGELETGVYLNSLSFFPAAFSETPQVGKYVSGIEYNPE